MQRETLYYSLYYDSVVICMIAVYQTKFTILHLLYHCWSHSCQLHNRHINKRVGGSGAPPVRRNDGPTIDFGRVSGARVIIACRDVGKGEQAVTDIKNDAKGDNLGQLTVEELDLASFDSIRRCAKRILENENRIHLLVNNAGE